MPRDARGKNRKFGHHKDRQLNEVTEEDIFEAIKKD